MSLTDDWKAGRLLCKNYWVKLINDDIIISFFNGLEFSCCKDFGIREILAPCDYKELQRLESDSLAKIEADEINAELEYTIKELHSLLRECIPFVENSCGVICSPEIPYLLERIKQVIQREEYIDIGCNWKKPRLENEAN